MLAPILLIDKGVNPTEALTLSNKYTYGNKFSFFLASIALLISFAVLLGLMSLISPDLGMIISILLAPVMGISHGSHVQKAGSLTSEGGLIPTNCPFQQKSAFRTFAEESEFQYFNK